MDICLIAIFMYIRTVNAQKQEQIARIDPYYKGQIKARFLLYFALWSIKTAFYKVLLILSFFHNQLFLSLKIDVKIKIAILIVA